MGQKTVIEILSDDSDDSDVVISFERSKKLGHAAVDEKPPGLSGARSNSTESRSLPTPKSCGSQTRPDASHAKSFTSNASRIGRNIDEPTTLIPSGSSSQLNTSGARIQPSIVSQTRAEESSSGNEDLRNILKSARKAKAQIASGKQLVHNTPVVTSAPLPSAGFQTLFGNQVKRTRNFFSSNEFHPSKPAHETASKDKTSDNVHTSRKRKACYDPFGVHLLNIGPQAEDRARKKKKKGHDTTQQLSYKSMSRQTPHAGPQHIPGRASTNDLNTDTRILGAQQASNWRRNSSPLFSEQTAFQHRKAKHSGHPHERKARNEPLSFFKPNKNAYHQPTFEDNETEDDDEITAPPLFAAAFKGPRTCRASKTQLGSSLRPNNSLVDQLANEKNGDFPGPRNSSANINAIASKTTHKALLHRRGFEGNNHQRLQRAHPPQLPRNIPIPIRSHHPRPQREQITREELDQAESHMTALMESHRKKHQAMIVDELPPGFGASEPLDIRRAREGLNRKKNKPNRDQELAAERRLAKNIRSYKQRTRKRVQKELSHESQKVQEEEIQKRIAAYLKKKEARLRQPKNLDVCLKSANLSAAFLEKDHDHDHEEAHEGQDTDRNTRRTPAYAALETLGPNVSIDKYTVVLSEPHNDGDVIKFNGTKAFGQMESANYYARMILDDETPPDVSSPKSKTKRQAFTDVISGKANGLFWGRGKLPAGKDAGKWLTVMVHKEQQMVGDLAPGALRNRYVDEEILDKYARDVYEVIMIHTVPKCFREAEDEDEKKFAIRKRQEERELKQRQKKQEQRLKESAKQPDLEEQDHACLEGDELRRMLAKLQPPGPLHEDADAKDADEDADDEGSLSETASQNSSDDGNSSEATVRSSSPAGDSYDRTPRNAFADLDHHYTPLGSFTSLLEANKTALSAARAAWAPRNASMHAHFVWTGTILPYLAREETLMMEEADDDEELHLVFPGFESGGPHTNHRPWGFTHSQLRVVKRELHGPVDLAIDYVQDVRDVYKATTFQRAVERAEQLEAQAVARAEGDDSEEDGPGAVELLVDDEPSDRESSDEEEHSEEE